MKAMNELAHEIGAASAQIGVKEAAGPQAERLVVFLESRVGSAVRLNRLRNAAKLWLDNGGPFSRPLLDAELSIPSSVSRHKVLQPMYELKSKAFMLTYNSREFVPTTWTGFREFVIGLQKKFGARA